MSERNRLKRATRREEQEATQRATEAAPKNRLRSITVTFCLEDGAWDYLSFVHHVDGIRGVTESKARNSEYYDDEVTP